MNISTEYVRRCVQPWNALWRNSNAAIRVIPRTTSTARRVVKEFEIILEQSGRLLRKRLMSYFASNRQVDHLAFKDLFRHAAKHGLIDAHACERWLSYRDNRNDTAHDYGEGFAEETLKLLPDFLADAKTLADVIDQADDG